MPDSRLDRWVQRAAVAAMVGVAAALLGMGFALYAPSAGAGGDAGESKGSTSQLTK